MQIYVGSSSSSSSGGGDPTTTRCIHAITNQDDNSVLSLACSEEYLFSGSQGSTIHVWSLDTFQLVTVLQGHHGSVLGLTISTDQQWLFSSSGKQYYPSLDTYIHSQPFFYP